MCRSLEEFRATYERLLARPPPPPPEGVGPAFKVEPSSDDEDNSEDHPEDHQRYRLVVKREAC